MFLENVEKGIERSILVSGYDEMKNPITRYSFGLDIGMGSMVEGYIDGRG